MSRCDHGVGVDSDDPLGCSTCDELRGYELADEDERAAERAVMTSFPLDFAHRVLAQDSHEQQVRRRLSWRLGDLLERLGRRLKGDRP